MSGNGNILGPSGSNNVSVNNTKDYDLRWRRALQDYNDNYILYLTKKVRDNNIDSSLRQKVIDLNKELKDIIEEVKLENENLIEKIKEKQQQFEDNQLKCETDKVTSQQSIDKEKKETITLNKKLKNINEKQEITGNIINLLYVICGVLFVVNILIIYFIIKKK
jgi:dsDNA-specific endonuclease/ATPase MutS2